MRPACEDRHMHLYQEKDGKHTHLIVPVKCKSWECPVCRRIKSKIVSDFIKNKFKNKQVYMWTLTHFRSKSLEETWRDLGECWNRLRTYVKKEFGEFEYVRVIEPHKTDGYPHAHIILDRYVNEGTLSKLLTAWGFGWNFHSKRMSSAGSARYVSKYLTKAWPDETVHEVRRATKARIVQGSRRLGAIFRKPATWHCLNFNIPTLLRESYAVELRLDIYAAGSSVALLQLNKGACVVQHWPVGYFCECRDLQTLKRPPGGVTQDKKQKQKQVSEQLALHLA